MIAGFAHIIRQTLRSFARSDNLRGMMAILVILAICLQMIAPNIAKAADLEWMVICSDDGAIMVQVDFSEDTPHEPCPDCETCVFCATASEGADQSNSDWHMLTVLIAKEATQPISLARWDGDYLWPVTRGPPSGKSEKKDRVFRAFPVLNSYKGEAL